MLEIQKNNILINALTYKQVFEYIKHKSLESRQHFLNIIKDININKYDNILILLYKDSSIFKTKLEYIQLMQNNQLKSYYMQDCIKYL